MKKSSLFLSLALLLAGCSSSKNMVYMSNDSYRIDEIAPTLKKKVDTLWFGLAQETNIYPNEVCKEYGYNEAIAVVNERETLQTLLTVVTFAFYSPRTVKIWCSGKNGLKVVDAPWEENLQQNGVFLTPSNLGASRDISGDYKSKF
ncbi:MAG: hypothetical protein IJT14_03395 [Rickettsiales bacterium]|nr:hypothetical protein [Rickettsiales bacterium]